MVFNMRTGKFEDEDEKNKKYGVTRHADGTVTIGGGGAGSVPASVWRADPVYKEAREAIQAGRVAEFNSAQARAGAQKRMQLPMTWEQTRQTQTAPKINMGGLLPALPPKMEEAGPAQRSRLANAGLPGYTGRRVDARTGQWLDPLQLALDKREQYQQAQRQAAAKAQPMRLPTGPSSYLLGGAPPKAPATSYAAAQSFTPGEIGAAKRQRQERLDFEQEVAGLGKMTLDDFLSKPGAFSKAEKAAAGKLLAKLERDYGPQIRRYQGSPRDGMGARPLPEGLQILKAKMDTLRVKSKAGEAALYGGLDSLTFGLSGKMERGEAQKRLAALASKGGRLTDKERAEQMILNALGGKTSFEAAREQSPLAYGAGKFAMEGAKYALGSAALDSIPLTGKLAGKAGDAISKATGGKISAEAAKRLVEGRVQDLPFDLINAAIEADSPQAFAKSVLGNQAWGLLTDSAMEGLAFGFRKIKQAAAKAGRLEGQLEKALDPGNIRDAEIDTYLRDYHAGNAPKASTFKPLPDRYEKVAMMEPVARITGKEFEKGAVNLPDQVTAYFDSLGGIVHNAQLGDIEISRRGVKDSMAHGIGRKKSAAFAVVPEVLTQGEIIDYQPNWKNRGYETYVIAAPVTIAGERNYVGAIVIKENDNRFYLHEVLTAKGGNEPFKTGRGKITSEPGGSQPPSLISLIRQLQDVNPPERKMPEIFADAAAMEIHRQSGGKFGGGFDPVAAPARVAEEAGKGKAAFNNLAAEQQKLGNLVYEDKKRIPDKLPLVGLQLPNMEAAVDPRIPDKLPGVGLQLPNMEAAADPMFNIPQGGAQINGQNGGKFGGGFDPVAAPARVAEEARKRMEEAVEPFVKPARSHLEQQQYMEQIRRVMRGDNPPDVIKIGTTPEILKKFGASDRVLTMKPTAVRKIAYPAGYMDGKHNLGFYALEHLPEQLENPVAILKSSTQRDSLVIFTEFLDAENRPVMAALHLDKEGRLGITNEVASVYGRNSFPAFLEEQRKLGNLVYEDKKRILDQLPGVGLQLPKMEAAADPMFNIPQGGARINGQNGGKFGGGFDPVAAPAQVAEEARKRMEEAVEPFVKPARSHLEQQQYMEQIRRVMRGDNPPDVIKIGTTPEILKEFGASDRVLTMKPTAVRKIAYPAGYMGGKHNLGFYALEHLPEQLENPVAILKSSTQKDSLVIFTEFLDAENRPVMAALHLDKDGLIGLTNEVASVYGRNSFPAFLEEQRKQGNLVYEDKKRILDQLPVIGLQLPKMEAAADPMFNIPQDAAQINGQNGGKFGGGFDPVAAPAQVAEDAQRRMRESMEAFFPPEQDGAEGFGPNSVGAAESAFPHKQKTSQLYDNTFQKTSMFTQAEKELANAAGTDKKFQYDVITEKQSMAEAAQRVALDAKGEMEDLPGKASWGGTDLDTAMLILEQKRDEWRKTKNSADLLQWAKTVQEKGTEAGQMIQAFAKYSRTPEGTIVKAQGAIADYAEKLRRANPKLFNAIDEFAEELARNSEDFLYDLPADPDAAVAKLKTAVEEFAKQHGKVELDDRVTDEIIRAIREGRGSKDAMEDILEAANGIPKLTDDDVMNIMETMAKAEDLPLYSKERFELENQAWKMVADHFDSSFMDKWNAWRYMAMLGNPRTHIRNMAGNGIFGVFTRVKNGVASLLESSVDKASRALGGEGIGRTKTFLAVGDRELQKAAKADFTEMYALVTGNGKYNPSDMLRDNMTVFHTKWLENFRKLNNRALEAEDAIALKGRYASSLAGWLKANGYGAGIFQDQAPQAQEALRKARAYAIQEAQKATFRDDSVYATALNALGRSGKVANVLVEGLLPFKKTPVNIVRRGLDYSPVGLARGAAEAVQSIRKGTKTAAEAIDHIASGLTGTGLMYLGFKLKESGLISGSGSEDARERGFDALTGNQNYALAIDGRSYTLDWAAPAMLPVFVGVELKKAMGERMSGAELLDAITKITEPVLDMTMMQGLNDAIQSAAYDQTGPLASIAVNTASNYFTQAVPTAFGQAARAADGTRRSTYWGGGAFLDRYLPENVKEAAGQIPGLDRVIQAELPKPLDIAAQKTMAKLPFFSMLLNPKIDQWGREQKNQGGSFAGRLAYNMLSPGFYSKQEYTAVDREIERLYGAVGEKGVLPGYASKTINQKDAQGNTEKKRLSAQEFVRFAKDRGGGAYESLDTLFQSAAYQRASDADKAKMVADIYEYTNAMAKTGVSSYEPSGWVEKAAQATKEGIPLEDYVLCRNVLTPLKHNVEKNEALLSMDAGMEEKETLYKYFVSDSESSRKKIKAFKAAGLDMDDYLTASVEYAHIEEKGGSAQEKATAFYQWLDGQGLNEAQYNAVAGSMPFFQMFPAKPEAYRVGLASDKTQEAYTALNKKFGITEQQFISGLNAVKDVEGVKGKNGKTISGSQKKARYQALANLPGWNGSGARKFLIEVYGYKDSGWT